MADNTTEAALFYHRNPRPGKLEIRATKPLATQRDLALAYSPGVAAASLAIAEDPAQAEELTVRGNLVGVITNGTAVLGLGAVGPLASKPVMEGKAVLFKQFAGIDVFDIEVDATDPDRFVDVVSALEPTFGGINLEDIKAPECFEIEDRLRAAMNIPVFHDDQHGTAIIVAAAVRNALKLTGKSIGEVRLVASGAGAASIACLNLLVSMGLTPSNIVVTDIGGVLHTGRDEPYAPAQRRYLIDTEARTLADVIGGADIFLGLSAPGVLTPEMVQAMAPRPLLLTLANPTPEIMPERVAEVRDDAIVATGRSDYPNQVNNVLCFPFLFRGTLDVGATEINEAMKIAAVDAIADLAMQESTDVVDAAYEGRAHSFGPEYIIPKPFDPRLLTVIATRVAEAAMQSGVARRPIEDMEAYEDRLEQFVYRSGQAMRPVFSRAKEAPKRLVFAEGEEERVLRAVQTLVDEKLARPILVGRPEVIENRLARLGLRLRAGHDFEITNPQSDQRFSEYWRLYHQIMQRRGVSPDRAREVVRTRPTVIAALMVRRGEADAGICGAVGSFKDHLGEIRDVISVRKSAATVAALSLLILPTGMFFIVDTHVTPDPTVDELVAMTQLAALEVRNFGLEPKVAFLSHSSFGTRKTPTASKMAQAVAKLAEVAPELEVEGEMHADAAISETIRTRLFPQSKLKGIANLLVMPNIDSANIAFSLLKQLGNGLSVGPMLLGLKRPMHVVTPSVSVRGLVNLASVAVVDAQEYERARQAKG
ncbi:NADP-dependent malic enzyme [hydrothermal vent metagenome]|uniref:NADP-dependent malic enzyme n=1 Tax=hydrothermal vent metagenome TaxID=652676 RepID=A0A3B0TUL7_9ZZZZ